VLASISNSNAAHFLFASVHPIELEMDTAGEATSKPADVQTRVISTHWMVICGFLPVGGHDGQWKVKRLCKDILPVDFDAKRLAWNEAYLRFMSDLRLGEEDTVDAMYHNPIWLSGSFRWTAMQRLLLKLMASFAVRLFRPRADRELMAPSNVVIRSCNSRRSGQSSAVIHFQIALLAHTSPDVHLRRHSLLDSIHAMPSSSRVSRRSTTYMHILPAETVYPDVIVCDGMYSARPNPSVLLRPGGVYFLVTRVHHDPTYTDRQQVAAYMRTASFFIELQLHGILHGQHYYNAVDLTDPQHVKLLASEHSRTAD
jgi:hypothetical protein